MFETEFGSPSGPSLLILFFIFPISFLWRTKEGKRTKLHRNLPLTKQLPNDQVKMEEPSWFCCLKQPKNIPQSKEVNAPAKPPIVCQVKGGENEGEMKQKEENEDPESEGMSSDRKTFIIKKILRMNRMMGFLKPQEKPSTQQLSKTQLQVQEKDEDEEENARVSKWGTLGRVLRFWSLRSPGNEENPNREIPIDPNETLKSQVSDGESMLVVFPDGSRNPTPEPTTENETETETSSRPRLTFKRLAKINKTLGFLHRDNNRKETPKEKKKITFKKLAKTTKTLGALGLMKSKAEPVPKKKKRFTFKGLAKLNLLLGGGGSVDATDNSSPVKKSSPKKKVSFLRLARLNKAFAGLRMRRRQKVPIFMPAKDIFAPIFRMNKTLMTWANKAAEKEQKRKKTIFSRWSKVGRAQRTFSMFSSKSSPKVHDITSAMGKEMTKSTVSATFIARKSVGQTGKTHPLVAAVLEAKAREEAEAAGIPWAERKESIISATNVSFGRKESLGVWPRKESNPLLAAVLQQARRESMERGISNVLTSPKLELPTTVQELPEEQNTESDKTNPQRRTSISRQRKDSLNSANSINSAKERKDSLNSANRERKDSLNSANSGTTAKVTEDQNGQRRSSITRRESSVGRRNSIVRRDSLTPSILEKNEDQGVEGREEKGRRESSNKVHTVLLLNQMKGGRKKSSSNEISPQDQPDDVEVEEVFERPQTQEELNDSMKIAQIVDETGPGFNTVRSGSENHKRLMHRKKALFKKWAKFYQLVCAWRMMVNKYGNDTSNSIKLQLLRGKMRTINELMNEAGAIKVKCQQEIEEMRPNVEEAYKETELPYCALDLMRSVRFNPPQAVQLVMGAICILKGLEPEFTLSAGQKIISHMDYWGTSKKLLACNFHEELSDLRKSENIHYPNILEFQEIILNNPDFNREKIKRAFPPCAILYDWILKVEAYGIVVCQVKEKQETIQTAENMIRKGELILKQLEKALRKVEKRRSQELFNPKPISVRLNQSNKYN